MSRTDFDRLFRELLTKAVEEVLDGMRSELPSRRQLQRMDERLRDIDRKVSGIERRQTGGRKVGRPRKNPETCSVRGCSDRTRARALCSRHYQQRRRHAQE